MIGVGKREGVERTNETVDAAGRGYECLRARYKVTPTAEGGKQGPAIERIYWINLSVPLTGLVKAEQFAPNGDKITLLLTGFGSGK